MHDGIQQNSLVHENPTTCRVLKLVTVFVNVNGRDRVLNSGPLSRRPDKSSTTNNFHTVRNIFMWNIGKGTSRQKQPHFFCWNGKKDFFRFSKRNFSVTCFFRYFTCTNEILFYSARSSLNNVPNQFEFPGWKKMLVHRDSTRFFYRL